MKGKGIAMSMGFNRLHIVLVGLVLLPLAATGQSGYITQPVGPYQSALMSVPFIVPGGNDIDNVFPGTGYDLYFWDTPLQVWVGQQKSGKGWPAPPREVLPGEAFFLHSTVNYHQGITVGGDIPTPPTTIAVSYKPCMLAYPYPQDVLWTNTQLSALLPEGSIVSFWSRASNCWYPAFLKAPAAKGGGWGNTAENYVIPAGDGFAVQQGPGGTNFNWIE